MKFQKLIIFTVLLALLVSGLSLAEKALQKDSKKVVLKISNKDVKKDLKTPLSQKTKKFKPLLCQKKSQK